MACWEQAAAVSIPISWHQVLPAVGTTLSPRLEIKSKRRAIVLSMAGANLSSGLPGSNEANFGEVQEKREKDLRPLGEQLHSFCGVTIDNLINFVSGPDPNVGVLKRSISLVCRVA